MELNEMKRKTLLQKQIVNHHIQNAASATIQEANISLASKLGGKDNDPNHKYNPNVKRDNKSIDKREINGCLE